MLRSRRLGHEPQLQRASEDNPPLRLGATGNGVKELQDALVDLGFPPLRAFAGGRADGRFDVETEAAVRAFQKSQGLDPNGIAGRAMLRRLDELIHADHTLETPDPAERARQEAMDRYLPLHLRARAHW